MTSIEPEAVAPESIPNNQPELETCQVQENCNKENSETENIPEPVIRQALETETKADIVNPVDSEPSDTQWIPLGTPTVCRRNETNNTIESNKNHNLNKFKGHITYVNKNGTDERNHYLEHRGRKLKWETSTLLSLLRPPVKIESLRGEVYKKGNKILVTNHNSEHPILVNQTALAGNETVVLSHGDVLTFANEKRNYNFRINHPSDPEIGSSK